MNQWIFFAFLMASCFSTIGSAASQIPYKTTKISTGLEVISMQSHKVPLVTIVLSSKAGGMSETPTTNGLTHLWEHMFFKGNKRLPNQEAFNRRIRELGIIYNGDTSAEKVRYFFTLPSSFLEEGLQFMSDAISTPLLEKEELSKETKVVLDEYDRSASQPGFNLRRLRRRIVYGSNDYLRDPLGERSIIMSATKEQLLKIKSQVFVPSNSALFIAGDFEESELHALVEKHFKDWKDPKDWKALPTNVFQPFPKTTEIIMAEKGVMNVQYSLTFDGPKARSNPTDSFAADVLINLLESRTGHFYKDFIDSGLTLQAGLNYFTQSQAGELGVYIVTTPENLKPSQEKILAEIEKWATPGYFDQEQLLDVRRSLLINYKRELNSPSSFIKSLAFWWAVTGLEYYGTYLDNLRLIELKDIREFVKKYFIKKPYLATTLLSPEAAKQIGIKDNASELMKKYKLSAGA